MPNIAGPKPSKRRTLMSVVHSIMLYGAEIWADALIVQKYRNCLSSVQRTAALRVARAYRTVSEIAVLVVAERKMLYHKRKRGEVISSTQVRSITLEKWQERWEQERDVGKWTYILIPRIEPWYTRKHGEISYYLYQFLTGHGLFNAYLYRIGKRNSAMCCYCSSEDDPRHTFFECERWESKRQLLQLRIHWHQHPNGSINLDMTTVLQGNLGRSRLAQDLLVQMAHEHRADVLIISEQYKKFER
nr:unnamed protein product [Callosobruchus chinensis]